MKPDNTRLPPEFAPETRFELRPVPPAPFRATLENEFDRLKNQLLAEQLYLARHAELHAPLRRAANEAAALAWSNLFPLLLFPALFDEKVAALTLQIARQKRIHAQTTEPIAA
jgi:hypothetical protein